MPNRNYIPTKLTDRAAWYDNFASYVADNFLALGLQSGDNDIIQAKMAAFATAFVAAQSAATRTPVTIATQVASDGDANDVARQYAQIMNNNPAVTDDQRAALQITIRTARPFGRITAPLTWPLLTVEKYGPLIHFLSWRDSAALSVKIKSKPFGAASAQLFMHVGATPPADPATAVFVGNFTRLPVTVEHDNASIGQTAYYYARWITNRGLEGPLVGPVSATVSNTA